MTKKENLTKISLVVSIILSLVLIINTSLSAYVLYTSSFQASMSDAEESLDIAIRTDTGRPSLLRQLFNQAQDWVSSYFVGGVERTDAETGITISVTGSNIASTANVDYYIEGVPQSGGHAFRFLEGNGSSVTVGGAALSPTNQTTIENHLEAMGLSTTESHTIDYYVYAVAEAVGVVSGETLTSEITYQKFDSVSYDYGTEITDTYQVSDHLDDGRVRKSDTSYEEHDSTAYIADFSSSLYDGEMWCRFQSVTIPDVDITEAHLELYANYWMAAPDRLFILGDYTGDAAYPTSYNDFYAKTRTTANVTWSDTFSSVMQWETSPDISNIVEEIMDHGSWSSGNDMQFFIEQNEGYPGSDQALAWRTHNGAASKAPKLSISYIGYEASWYPIPPLSVISVPITLDLVAVLSVLFAAFVVVKTKMEENRK